MNPTACKGTEHLPSRLVKIYQTLNQNFPSMPDWPNGDWPISGRFRPPHFEIVVGAILTQNTNWRNVQTSLNSLLCANLSSPLQIKDAPDEKLQKAIQSSGFYRRKTKSLKAIAGFIVDCGVNFYRKVQRQELLSMTGIGPETADSILLYACQRLHFVVDAYTLRILSRYGVLEKGMGYHDIQKLLELQLPVDLKLYKHFHALLVEHAKKTCRSRPLCSRCSFWKECAYAIEVVS